MASARRSFKNAVVEMESFLLREADRLFPEKPLLSVADVARFLSCEERVVHNWLKRGGDGTPPKLIIGKEVRFPKETLIQWIAEYKGQSIRA